MAASISNPRQVPQTGNTCTPVSSSVPSKDRHDCHLSRRVGELGEVHQVGGGLCVGGGEDGDRAAGDEQPVNTGEYLDTV